MLATIYKKFKSKHILHHSFIVFILKYVNVIISFLFQLYIQFSRLHPWIELDWDHNFLPYENTYIFKY